ncbi:CDP-glycerol glycerophosphotransferase family protein [Psychroflexus sp. CAK57W]|uniref:CDP-glycerol glycerophosphotransferase family protein n=1 Tax=Psychroflexus curvus TaxID=2873595 RepID=UPI001CC9BB96|nr:CDP-glycerol glycerophosphotransferase family protein [Psychroflexus curvus]MBZ9786733.1 CDP-glycerol glycerophosphotransferase family protein [Psychroflexus curvus]
MKSALLKAKILIYRILSLTGIIKIVNNIQFKMIKKFQEKKFFELKNKRNIKVLFIVVFDSVWKYEQLYKFFEKDKRFTPLISIAPYTNLSENESKNQLNSVYKEFRSKGYNVRKDLKNPKTEYDPDIVFFTVPYGYTKKEFQISNYKSCLTCYVPYAFVVISRIELHYSKPFYRKLWRYYMETKIHKKMCKTVSNIDDNNIYVSGYPGLDNLIPKPNSDKKKNNSIKSIIWAPHHSISQFGAGLNYSSFEAFHVFFKQIMEIYDNKIAVVFKPHPLLKGNLYKSDEWGKKKTDDYYSYWKNHSVGSLEEGAYEDLFSSSDALIHDCASFMAEYMVTGKPLLYLANMKKNNTGFNRFGDMLYEKHYKASAENEISEFIEKVVIGEDDFMKNVRQGFVSEFLINDNETASQKIYKNILNELT